MSYLPLHQHEIPTESILLFNFLFQFLSFLLLDCPRGYSNACLELLFLISCLKRYYSLILQNMLYLSLKCNRGVAVLHTIIVKWQPKISWSNGAIYSDSLIMVTLKKIQSINILLLLFFSECMNNIKGLIKPRYQFKLTIADYCCFLAYFNSDFTKLPVQMKI